MLAQRSVANLKDAIDGLLKKDATPLHGQFPQCFRDEFDLACKYRARWLVEETLTPIRECGRSGNPRFLSFSYLGFPR